VRVNGVPWHGEAKPGQYVRLHRHWHKGDRVDIALPMRPSLEVLPGKAGFYALLNGPIVLAAKGQGPAGEQLNYLAGDARMDHIAQGPVCAQEAAPLFVRDPRHFASYLKGVPGEPLTLVSGITRFVPFFRLHDSRYTIYWTADPAPPPVADLLTIDQVAPGEQQPESDHQFNGEASETGLHEGRHWRHARGWFRYVLNNPRGEAKRLRLTLYGGDAARSYDIVVNGALVATVEGSAPAAGFYERDVPLPALPAGPVDVKFVAHAGSLAGGLYGLRLLRD
jgi:hypothetical protein